MNVNVSLIFGKSNTVSARVPVGKRERIRASHYATHAVKESTPELATGTLTPVIFSGGLIFQPAKIHEINKKIEPYPPKSDLLNPMVISIYVESAWKTRYDTDNQNCSNNGDSNSGRSCLHVMHHS